MAVTEYASLNAVSISGTEISIISGTSSLQSKTDNGVYSLILDPVQAALAKGDYFQVKIYEKVLSGGTQRVMFQTIIGNAQAEPWLFPPLMLKNGWDMTLKKIAGTDRNWDASIRGASGTITEAYTMSAVTVGASELSIVSGTTALQTKAEAGIYQLFVDPVTNMAKADDYVIRVYEKTKNTKRQIYESNLMDVQMENFVTPVFTLINGWDMTMQKISGTDRAFSAGIRKVA
jgi:nitrogen fixation protein